MTSLIALLALPLMGALHQAASPADLFKDGHFAEAIKACDVTLQSNPNDIDTAILKGRALVFSNRLDDAKQVLTPIPTSNTATADQKKTANSLLGEAAYRQDDFAQAATYCRAAGKDTKAAQLEDFKSVTPNEISDKTQTATVKFEVTDPLPVVSLKANGVEGRFIIDTGAGETVLDPDFAAKIGVKALAGETGTFAGGAKATQQNGRLESLRLDAVTIKNIPVHILNTKNFAAEEFKGPIDGIIGTVLFYHFLTTLDYPHNRLILAPRKPLADDVTGVPLPFWLASDHIMVTWGRLGNSADRLFLVDTGLSGAAFTGPKSITDEAGIKVSMDNAQMGQGGGGAVKMAPYEVPSVSLGPVKAEKLIGVYGAFPDSLENALGFHLSGIISHQFFRPYLVTFDFDSMEVVITKP